MATHSDDDRLLTLRGSIQRDYTYNNDGDIKTMTNCYGTTTYDYDIFGNLKKVTMPNGSVIEYKVDALNRRVKKIVNGQVKEYYLWYDQIHLAAILDANKQAKITYLYNLSEANAPSMMIKDGITYKFLHDPVIGSIRYAFNAADNSQIFEIEYDEYGNILNNSNGAFQPILYAGGLYDSDTKLYRFGARDYDPTIGRWLTKDAAGLDGGTTNLYEYAYSNPMSFYDDTGYNPKQDPVNGIPSGGGGGGGAAGGNLGGAEIKRPTTNPNPQPPSNSMTGRSGNQTDFKGCSPDNISGRNYTGHSLDSMRNRGITPTVVENTISTGSPMSQVGGTTQFYDPINNISVILNGNGGVVTVFPGK